MGIYFTTSYENSQYLVPWRGGLENGDYMLLEIFTPIPISIKKIPFWSTVYKRRKVGGILQPVSWLHGREKSVLKTFLLLFENFDFKKINL